MLTASYRVYKRLQSLFFNPPTALRGKQNQYCLHLTIEEIGWDKLSNLLKGPQQDAGRGFPLDLILSPTLSTTLCSFLDNIY